MASSIEKALHAALKKREFDPVYYFFGDDDFLKEARTRELIAAAVDPATRDFNLELLRGGELSAEGIDSLLATPPMLAERRETLPTAHFGDLDALAIGAVETPLPTHGRRRAWRQAEQLWSNLYDERRI